VLPPVSAGRAAAHLIAGCDIQQHGWSTARSSAARSIWAWRAVLAAVDAGEVCKMEALELARGLMSILADSAIRILPRGGALHAERDGQAKNAAGCGGEKGPRPRRG
jgi:hypothetical protein